MSICAEDAHARATSSTAMASPIVPAPAPPSLSGKRERKQPLIPKRVKNVLWVLAILVDLPRARRNLIPHQFAHGMAQQPQFLRKRIVERHDSGGSGGFTNCHNFLAGLQDPIGTRREF